MKSYGVQNEVKAYCNRIQNETSVIVTPSLVKTLNDRVESLKKSGVWSQYGLGFNDADADSYFQRASVNNLLGRFEVCLFVRGMKTLGLWQNMVCWPLRSSQNAASGNTMFSLGGLGTFNGTLFNNPTRGADGINTVAQNVYIGNIGLTINLATDTYSIFSVSKRTVTTDYHYIWIRATAASGPGFRSGPSNEPYRYYGDNAGTSFATITSAGPSTATHALLISKSGTNSINTSFNGGTFVATSISGVSNTGSSGTLDMGNNASWVATATRSFEVIFNGSILSQDQSTKLYALYKATLGQGLGLP